MTVAVGAALAVALSAIAGLHIFWAWRGLGGGSIAIPEVDGRPALRPTRAATLAVAAALLLAAWIALAQGGLIWPRQAGGLARWGAGGCGAVFVARAIGEFRLVGFFKRVRGTPFARWDTRLFSPLCVLLGCGFWYLVVAA